jgi:KDO2-lipid IV(A) lauroyltransferase
MPLDRHHRTIVLDNLSIAFPDWPSLQRANVARAAFSNWGRIASELVHVDAMLAEPRAAGVVEMGERIREQLSFGKGLLVLSAHTANFEVLVRMAGERGRELVVFHRAMSNELVNGHLVEARGRAHVGSLGRGASVREAVRVLARGGVIVAPMDQNQPRRKGIFVVLFGRPACTSTFLARLSILTGAPVLPVFAVWEDEQLTARLGTVIGAPREVVDRRATIESLTARYTSEIEAAVREYPEQWNWAHRRWKTRPLPKESRPEITPTSVEDNGAEARSDR